MSELVKDQKPPVPNDHPPTWGVIVREVEDSLRRSEHPDPAVWLMVDDMAVRDSDGLKKYGVRLQPHNGRDSMVDAYQEILGACVYMRNAAIEAGNPADLLATYEETLRLARWIRRRIFARDGR